jgi:hypothetical protein
LDPLLIQGQNWSASCKGFTALITLPDYTQVFPIDIDQGVSLKSAASDTSNTMETTGIQNMDAIGIQGVTEDLDRLEIPMSLDAEGIADISTFLDSLDIPSIPSLSEISEISNIPKISDKILLDGHIINDKNFRHNPFRSIHKHSKSDLKALANQLNRLQPISTFQCSPQEYGEQ